MMLAIFELYSNRMLKIHKNYSLAEYNTFGVHTDCEYFCQPASMDDLIFAVDHARERSWDVFLLGEGSNILFTETYPGMIIHLQFQEIDLIDESGSEVLLRTGAGVNWDKFVEYCVNNDWYGAENLSLIPGSVGAAPVQNIGAYGVEIGQLIEYVEVLDIETLKSEILSNSECQFGYRDSVFKHSAKDRYIVTHVVFRLRKEDEMRLDYGNVKEEFEKQKQQDLVGLRNTIINIRRNKLPDPVENGNAGSFFKNPVISNHTFDTLKSKHTSIPGYKAGQLSMKVPAAWLIDQAGWKGIREGAVGTWPNQPLVIVNYGEASGREIFDFSEKIRLDVQEKFGIELEREVTVI